MKSLSRVRRLATPWTAAHQAPLSMGFFRQEYWSGVPLPSPKGDWGNTYSHGTKSQGRGNSRLANMPRRDLLLSTFFLCPSISQRARKICLTCSIHNLSYGQFERKRTDQALIHLGSLHLFPKVPLLYLYGGRSTSRRY